MGMPGKTGAIDHVTVENGALRAHVLGGGTPQGVCGSGVIDGLACLLELDLLDETGLLEEDPAVLQAPVSLSQKDVRLVQLAKSAVCSGLTTLRAPPGVPAGEVEELAVAGGFGSYLNVASAGKIGLLPQELVPKVPGAGQRRPQRRGHATLKRDLTLREPAPGGILPHGGPLRQPGVSRALYRQHVFLARPAGGGLAP